jgi:hypothetical protein
VLTHRLTLGTVIVASVLLAGCGGGAGAGVVRDLCGLADLPHGTPAELTALRDKARQRLSAQHAFVGSARNKRIVSAAERVAVFADSEAKLATAPPELRSLFASAQPSGMSLSAGLADLRNACG